MAKSAEIQTRRKKLCALVYRGVLPRQASDKLAEAFEVTADTILNDWYKREEWLPHLFELDNPKKILVDLLSEQKEFKQELWNLKRSTKNDNIKLGALKQLQETNKNLLNMLQDVGVVSRENMTLEITGKDGGAIEIDGKSVRDKLIGELDSIAGKG